MTGTHMTATLKRDIHHLQCSRSQLCNRVLQLRLLAYAVGGSAVGGAAAILQPATKRLVDGCISFHIDNPQVPLLRMPPAAKVDLKPIRSGISQADCASRNMAMLHSHSPDLPEQARRGGVPQVGANQSVRQALFPLETFLAGIEGCAHSDGV